MVHLRCFGTNGARTFRIAVLTCLLSCAIAVCAVAGPDTAGTGRHLKVGDRPEYPELARKLNIRGTVRVQLLIAPDGHVKNTKVLGGSPVLVQAVVDAVRKWKYEPADAESTQIVKFEFDPLGSAK